MSARALHVLRAIAAAVALICLSCLAVIAMADAAMRNESVATALEMGASAQGPAAILTGPDADCRACHANEAARYAASGHAGLVCTECHGAHDGPAQLAGLRDPAPVLCRECHSTAEGTWHVSDGEFKDELTGGPLTCVSSCHDPHGTAYPGMTPVPADELCLRCHAGIGIWE